ncbi:KilA-N domain-containing protein [Pseudomonas sp. NY15463]|uniref:KilA-N domain-containing protein n=1 Tax=Pseudomonas sp. NY15463 TaxID=3400361 RepID=UPI003A863602
MDIKHKHSGHLIIIEGHAFKADHSGRWDLTDIWRTLGLHKGKAPSQWRTRQAQRMEAMQNLHSSNGTGSWATKRATIAYAAWVSDEFETTVYDAFEAILESPEVAALVADKMAALGNAHSATILRRMTFNDRCDWKALKGSHRNTQQGLKAAVELGHISHTKAVELGLKVS